MANPTYPEFIRRLKNWETEVSHVKTIAMASQETTFIAPLWHAMVTVFKITHLPPSTTTREWTTFSMLYTTWEDLQTMPPSQLGNSVTEGCRELLIYLWSIK